MTELGLGRRIKRAERLALVLAVLTFVARVVTRGFDQFWLTLAFTGIWLLFALMFVSMERRLRRIENRTDEPR